MLVSLLVLLLLASSSSYSTTQWDRCFANFVDMLTTGILSLNIHDSLTFEGTEICLNPDLFTLATAEQSSGGSSLRNNKRGTGTESTASGNSNAGSASHNSATATTTALSVDDILEIRVWDPLPKEAGGGKTPSSITGILRKRLHQAPILPIPSTNNTTPIDKGKTNATSGEGCVAAGTVPSLRPRTAAYPAIDHSLQRSCSLDQIDNDGSPKSSNIHGKKSLMVNDNSNESLSEIGGEGRGGVVVACSSASTTTPTITNNVINPTGMASQQLHLPPVFPRNRSGTHDLNAQSVTKPPKPITVHRRSSSHASAIPPLPLPQRSPKQQQHHQIPVTRHSRDISDMTADTTYQLDSIINDAIIHHRSGSPETTDEVVENDALSDYSSKYRLRLSFVMKVTKNTLSSFKGNSRAQVSILKQIAELYNLSTYDLVTVHKIEPQDNEEVLKVVSADFVVVTIKDQFISRGDMVLFQTKLIGSWIYEGQRLTESTRGIMAHAREIRHGNFSAKSGIVTDETMITFRSRSARIIWLVQLSSEMWEYSSPYERQYEPEAICEIYFDQWISFLYKLFSKWKELEVS